MMMPPCRRQSQIVNGARSKAVPAVFKGIIELLAVTQQWEKAQFDIEEVIIVGKGLLYFTPRGTGLLGTANFIHKFSW